MKSIAIAILIISACSLNEQARGRLFEAVRCSDLMGMINHKRTVETTVPDSFFRKNQVTEMQFNDMRIFPARYATAFLISGDVFNRMDLLNGDIRSKKSLLIDLDAEMQTGRKHGFFQKNPGQRERTTEGTPLRGEVMFRSDGNLNHQKQAEMSCSFF